jgi:hypothetical protein
MTKARLIIYVDDKPIVTDFDITTDEQKVEITITPEGAQINCEGEPRVLATPIVGQTVYIDRGDSIDGGEDVGQVTEVGYTEAGSTLVTVNRTTYNLDEVPHWEIL